MGIGIGSHSVRAEVFRLSPRIELPALMKAQGTMRDELFILKESVTTAATLIKVKSGQTLDTTLKDILIAQAALISDPELVSMANTYIEEGWSASSAIQMAVNDFRKELEGAGGEFEERIADLDEIPYRIVRAIQGESDEESIPSSGNYIVVARDLSPMDTVNFTDAVVGVVTEAGGPTSHTAIICRARNIPAVVACKDLSKIVSGDFLLIDPVNSRVVINGEISHENVIPWWEKLPKIGKSSVQVMANVGSLIDAAEAQRKNITGVGLLRTELFYLSQEKAPNLTEQIELYTQIFAAGPDGQIIVRTLDAGSDKPVPFLNLSAEKNPALGVRGYRLNDDFGKFLDSQLRAIFEAGQNVRSTGKQIEVSIMAPMISTYEEVSNFAKQARAIGFTSVGVMVEVPALAINIKSLAGLLDFVSIGTNDLSQYLFAADREQSAVAHLLDAWHPVLLNLLANISRDCFEAKIKIGICGEAASDPLLAPFFAGIGINSLSCSAFSIDPIQEVLDRMSLALTSKVVEQVLLSQTPEQARAAVRIALSTS